MSTGIEWTDETWNPTTGCDKVSPGCDNCYALGMAKRLKAMGQADYQTDGDPRTSGPGFGLRVQKHRINQPLKWRKPRKIFVNSMSDLFHDAVPNEWLAEIFAVMAATPQHTYQILTKRHGRMRSLMNNIGFRVMVADRVYGKGGEAAELPAWPLPNVWLGVSVENQQWADIRIPALLDTPAAVRFLSCEPLLGPVDLSKWLGPVAWPNCWDDHSPSTECSFCIQPEWVIVGGESGPNARPMHPDWARNLRNQCEQAGVAFLFKQWGEWAPAHWKGEGGATHAFTGGYVDDHNQHFMKLDHQPTGCGRSDQTPPGAQGMTRPGKKAAGRELDGRTWDQYPQAVTA